MYSPSVRSTIIHDVISDIYMDDPERTHQLNAIENILSQSRFEQVRLDCIGRMNKPYMISRKFRSTVSRCACIVLYTGSQDRLFLSMNRGPLFNLDTQDWIFSGSLVSFRDKLIIDDIEIDYPSAVQ
jgi:hypothetical protein